MGLASIKRSGGVASRDPENAENTEVNNASRNGNERVLKSILVIRGIKKYQSILLCHLT